MKKPFIQVTTKLQGMYQASFLISARIDCSFATKSKFFDANVTGVTALLIGIDVNGEDVLIGYGTEKEMVPYMDILHGAFMAASKGDRNQATVSLHPISD